MWSWIAPRREHTSKAVWGQLCQSS